MPGSGKIKYKRYHANDTTAPQVTETRKQQWQESKQKTLDKRADWKIKRKKRYRISEGAGAEPEPELGHVE